MAMFAIGILVGILIGFVFRIFMSKSKSVGSLRIDTSDPDDGPYLFLELSKGLVEIYRKKYVMLKVDIQNYIPHK